MPRKLPPFVERWRDRHGKMRHYFRKAKGARVPLPGPETAEFEAAYQAALMGQPIPKLTRQVEAHGSIGALIASYLRHAEYIGLRESTKFGYASRIETLRTKHGHRSVAGLTRERIVTGILQPYADRPGAALAILKSNQAREQHRLAQGRSLSWHQETEDQRSQIMDRCRDRRI